METKHDIIAKALATEEGKKTLAEIIQPMISWYQWEVLAPKVRNLSGEYYEPDYPILYTEEEKEKYNKLWNKKG